MIMIRIFWNFFRRKYYADETETCLPFDMAVIHQLLRLGRSALQRSHQNVSYILRGDLFFRRLASYIVCKFSSGLKLHPVKRRDAHVDTIPFSWGIDPTLCAARLQFIVV